MQSEQVLEAEYKNSRQHTAFMIGQIRCEKGGSGEIHAELFDAEGARRYEMSAGAHDHEGSRVACNTLTMPVPPRWSVKCYRVESHGGISTKWAEID